MVYFDILCILICYCFFYVNRIELLDEHHIVFVVF